MLTNEDVKTYTGELFADADISNIENKMLQHEA